MLKTIHKLLIDDDGATMVEYAIMVALIAAVCFTIVTTLGKSVSNTFSSMNGQL